MANGFIEKEVMQDIANAIREKNGSDTKYKAGEMGDAVRAIESGGEDLFPYIGNLTKLFFNVDFGDREELEITLMEHLHTMNNIEATYFATGTKGLRKIKVNCSNRNVIINTPNMFNNTLLEEVDLSDFKVCYNNISNMFVYAYYLKKIIGELDFSTLTANPTNTFYSCNALEEVTLKKETLSRGTTFAQSKNLSDRSIQSIIDGLATVETPQTIYFHSNVVMKLTEEQMVQISDKNWNLG